VIVRSTRAAIDWQSIFLCLRRCQREMIADENKFLEVACSMATGRVMQDVEDPSCVAVRRVESM
jgi:hypothetical protein